MEKCSSWEVVGRRQQADPAATRCTAYGLGSGGLGEGGGGLREGGGGRGGSGEGRGGLGLGGGCDGGPETAVKRGIRRPSTT